MTPQNDGSDDELLDPNYWVNAPPDYYAGMYPAIDYDRLRVAQAFADAADLADARRTKRQTELDEYLRKARDDEQGTGPRAEGGGHFRQRCAVPCHGQAVLA